MRDGALRRAMALVRRPEVMYLAATALARAGSILLVPLYGRRLSVAEFGDYSLAQSILLLLPHLLNLSTTSAVYRFFFDDAGPVVGGRRAAAASRLAVLLSGSLGALLAIGAWLGRPATPGLFGRWGLLCVVIASASAVWASIPPLYLQAAQRPIAASAFQILQLALTLGSGAVLVGVADRGLVGSLEALAVTYGFGGLVALVFIFRLPADPLDRPFVLRTLKFSFPFLPHLAANNVSSAADRWVLKAYRAEQQLGSYAISAQILGPTNMILQAWNDAESARLGEVRRAGGVRGVRDAFWRFALRSAAAAAIPGLGTIALLPVARFLVGAKLGAQLHGGFVAILVATQIVDAIYFPAMNSLYFLDRTRLIPLCTVPAAFLNPALCALLIPSLGIWGVGVSRLCTALFRSGTLVAVARYVMREALRDEPHGSSPPTPPAPTR